MNVYEDIIRPTWCFPSKIIKVSEASSKRLEDKETISM